MAKNKFPKIYKLSKKQVKEVSQQSMDESKALWEKHCSDIKDFIALLLKCHLLIEKYLEDILKLCLPNPNKILENSKFSTKVKLLESLDIFPSSEIIKKIRTTNNLRNWFAHNLDKKLTEKEKRQLYSGLGIKPKELSNKTLGNAMQNIIGYLCSTKAILKLFPFIHACKRNQSLFCRDKSFALGKTIVKNTMPEILKILDDLKV